MHKKILASLAMAILIIPLGLLSRHIAWLPQETGDALWAMMIFCLWRALLARRGLATVAAVSLAHAWLVEFSQLLRWPWLVEFRSTFVGHMMLGQGFVWADLLAYAIGIACICWLFSKTEQTISHS